MFDARTIKESLNRIIRGESTSDDRRLLQSAFLSGEIVNIDGEKNITAGGDLEGNIIFAGDLTLNLEFGSENLQKLKDLVFPPPIGVFPPFSHLVFVGRSVDLTNLKNRLGVGSRKSFAPVIVRGWPGVGKTTLVSVLSRDADVTSAFPDGILWASLQQKPDLISILSGWGRALGRDDLLRLLTPEEIAHELSISLQNKRMLLIVDDIWEARDGILFHKIKGSGCGLLLTTRLEKVAHELSQTDDEIYILPVLTEADGQKLLQFLAPEVSQKFPNECRNLINSLERLPLAIHVAAKLLRREYKNGWGIEELLKEIDDGAKILEAKAPADRAEKGQIPTVQALLRKSSDLLSEQNRDYFAHLGNFAPKPATFSEDALRFVWKSRDPRPIIRELHGNGLLEPVGNGRFQMHALLVAHARSLCS